MLDIDVNIAQIERALPSILERRELSQDQFRALMRIRMKLVNFLWVVDQEKKRA